MTKIHLHCYGPALGVVDLSPFCIKLQSYFKIADIPFKIRLSNPRNAPKGKLPYITYENEYHADTHFVIQFVNETFDVNLDASLTTEQRILSTTFRSAIEEHLYFILLYFRWQDDAGWSSYKSAIQDTLKRGGVPGLLAPIIAKLLRNNVLKSLEAQGTGRHQKKEVTSLGKEHIHTMAEFLGEKPFTMGDQPTRLDATFYAFLSSIIVPDIESPLKKEAKSRENLVAYCDRFQKTYFPELTIET